MTTARTIDGGSITTVDFFGPPKSLTAAVRNAPFSAVQIMERTRTLGDGTRIVEKAEPIATFRDSEGRRRFEERFPIGQTGEFVDLITIRDYVDGYENTIDLANREVHRMKFSPTAISAPSAPTIDRVSFFFPASPVRGAAPKASRVRQNLLPKTFEGFLCDGTLDTTTIPVGAEGNDKPIVVTDENWYARELNYRIFATHNDPRDGESVTRVTDIRRGEPRVVQASGGV